MTLMETLGELEAEFLPLADSSYRQRGLRRIAQARAYSVKDVAYSERMLAEARFELDYARELNHIKILRGK